ncbi:MAG: hypothetical protein ACOX80_05645 [Methanomassiliicoccaceae archaeon]|nr:hypothetical protein [Methanomassiliicoccaceae archaeon]HPP45329.1 hypothetical protein [Methanomassiliicoccaceae archaeon]
MLNYERGSEEGEMWLPGHLALSFMLCLPLLVLVKRERLLALYYVAFFALLPDYVHVGVLRTFSHSFTGLAIMLIVSLGTLAILFRPRPVMYVIASLSAVGHLLGDLYIGSIHPFWPFDDTWYQLHTFNSSFDIATEVMLSSIALLLLAMFGPFRLFSSRRQLDRRECRNLFLLATLVGAMALLQGGYYALIPYLGGGDAMRNLLLLFFAVPLLYTSALLFPMTFSDHERCGAMSDLSSSGLRKL